MVKKNQKYSNTKKKSKKSENTKTEHYKIKTTKKLKEKNQKNVFKLVLVIIFSVIIIYYLNNINFSSNKTKVDVDKLTNSNNDNNSLNQDENSLLIELQKYSYFKDKPVNYQEHITSDVGFSHLRKIDEYDLTNTILFRNVGLISGDPETGTVARPPISARLQENKYKVSVIHVHNSNLKNPKILYYKNTADEKKNIIEITQTQVHTPTYDSMPKNAILIAEQILLEPDYEYCFKVVEGKLESNWWCQNFSIDYNMLFNESFEHLLNVFLDENDNVFFEIIDPQINTKEFKKYIETYQILIKDEKSNSREFNNLNKVEYLNNTFRYKLYDEKVINLTEDEMIAMYKRENPQITYNLTLIKGNTTKKITKELQLRKEFLREMFPSTCGG